MPLNAFAYWKIDFLLHLLLFPSFKLGFFSDKLVIEFSSLLQYNQPRVQHLFSMATFQRRHFYLAIFYKIWKAMHSHTVTTCWF